jgi:hypothetical protein
MSEQHGAAQRRNDLAVSNAEDALAALLTVGSELQLQVNLLVNTYGERVAVPDKEEVGVLPTLNRLADRVDALTGEITRLANEQEQQRTRIGVVAKRGFWVALLAVVLAVALAGAVGLTVTRVEVQRLAAEQEQQRAQVLCPFFGLILGSYRPETRPEGVDRDTYVSQFAIMRDIYDRLHCTSPAVPPVGG